MTPDKHPSNGNESLNAKREKGAEIRKAVAERVSGFFKRFGKGVVGGIDTSIGATVEGAAFVGEKAVETKDAVIETAIKTRKFAMETKEDVVTGVKNTVEGAKILVDTGVEISKEKYAETKNTILEAKKGVLSYVESIKNKWEKKRIDKEKSKVQADIQSLIAAGEANARAMDSLNEQYARKLKQLEALNSLCNA